ncbi:MAG TPA: putative lipid II flippase FtsW [Spirochaetia bacterium]|nr:putative lipid II flippase FtsW [Spirochaetia bacterium]
MERIEREQIDYLFVVLVILLLGIGMSLLFSASYYHSEKLGKGPLHLFNKQLVFVILGSLAFLVFSRLPLSLLRRFMPVIVVVTFLASLLPFIPGIGREINGARRWISFLDYTFQPSELVKFTVVLYIASILHKKEDRLDQPLNTLLPPLIMVFVFAVIIYFQNDLSTSFFIVVVALSMFFIAKVRFLYFLYIGSLFIPLGGIIIFTKSYWIEKIITYFDPSRDPFRTGFQMRHSHHAFELGGLFGRGLGMSTQKLGFLPEADSDFIFAIAGEELGFLGISFLVLLFGLFAVRAYSISFKSRDNFSYYLGFGITTTIVLQALLNMLVTAGLVPATGMPLPFFSVGGSAMLMTLAMCGILVNISRDREKDRGRFHV